MGKRPRHEPAKENDREKHIEEIKQKLQQMSGNQMMSWESGELSAAARDKFWRQVMAYENGPFTCDFERLEKAGVALPEPQSLDDAALTAKLWEVIGKLAELRVFISRTDHLSDRELYSRLWTEILRQEVPVAPEDDDGVSVVDVVGTGDEDNSPYFKYYADEDERKAWLQEFPTAAMPAHEERPYSRDHRLPKPPWERGETD